MREEEAMILLVPVAISPSGCPAATKPHAPDLELLEEGTSFFNNLTAQRGKQEISVSLSACLFIYGYWVLNLGQAKQAIYF